MMYRYKTGLPPQKKFAKMVSGDLFSANTVCGRCSCNTHLTLSSHKGLFDKHTKTTATATKQSAQEQLHDRDQKLFSSFRAWEELRRSPLEWQGMETHGSAKIPLFARPYITRTPPWLPQLACSWHDVATWHSYNTTVKGRVDLNIHG